MVVELEAALAKGEVGEGALEEALAKVEVAKEEALVVV